MQKNSSPTSLVLEANTPRSLLISLAGHLERKIAARWQEWEPWVWLYLRQRGCAPAGSPELARLRRRHSEHLLDLMRVGIEMRLVRRHRLDDPRVTDEVRAVLVRAARERQTKAWLARQRGLSNPQSWKTLFREAAVADFLRHQESSQIPPWVPRNIIASQEKGVTIDLVRKRVSAHFKLCEQDLNQRSNRRAIAFPRQVAMYMAKQLTTASLQEIGRQFGGRHHATVLHSINKIAEMRLSDEGLHRTITRLMDSLQQLASGYP